MQHDSCKEVVLISITFFSPSPGEAAGRVACMLKHNSLLLSVLSQADKKKRPGETSAGETNVTAKELSN